MNTYTLVLKRVTAQCKMPIISFDVCAPSNELALSDAKKCVIIFLKEEGYKLVNAGVPMGNDLEMNLTFTKDDEEYDYILNIIHIKEDNI